MAINPLSLCEISPTCSLSVKSGPARLKAMAFQDDHKITKRRRKKFKGSRSPYLHAGDRISYLERITEKKTVHKQADGFRSSFPLATNVYKASSDELKVPKHKSNKKVKKSVLTLPNEQSPMPQTCTVSDVSEAEYARETMHKVPNLKRAPLKKKRLPAKGLGFYDRDARISSQMNLEYSSSDILKHFEGDCKRSKRNKKKEPDEKEGWKPHDVWTVLRDINRFQFNPSPPMSVESEKKTVVVRKRNTRKGNRRLIETCRTEEISYVANFEFETTQHITPTTSCDRITVIDMKLDNQNGRVKQIKNAFEKRIQETCARNQIATNENKEPTGKKENKLALNDHVEKRMQEKSARNNDMIALSGKKENKLALNDHVEKRMQEKFARNNDMIAPSGKKENKRTLNDINNKETNMYENKHIDKNNPSEVDMAEISIDSSKENKLALNDINNKETKMCKNKHIDKNNPSEVDMAEKSIDSSNYYAHMYMAAGDKPITKQRHRLVRDEHNANDPMIKFRPKVPVKGINIQQPAQLRDNRVNKLHPERTSPLRKLANVFLGRQTNDKVSQENICHVQKRKPQLMTMLSATAIPKFTVADIKRKLAQLRFPIVVLGKDKVSSSFEMADCDPPQFHGLDKHIWPFMTEWKKRGKTKARGGLHTDNKQATANNWRPVKEFKKVANEIAINKHSKDRRDNENYPAKKRVDHNKIHDIQFETTDSFTAPPVNHVTNSTRQKTNNMRHGRDKKLKLIYKKSLDLAADSDEYQNDQKLHARLPTMVDIATEPIVSSPPVVAPPMPTKPSRIVTATAQIKQSYTPMAVWTPADGTMVPMSPPEANLPKVAKQPWSKAKFTNDFIDSVIKNVNKGVYYNCNKEPRPKKVEFVDLISLCRRRYTGTEDEVFDRNAVSIQTPRSLRSTAEDSDIEELRTELASCTDVVALPKNYDPLKKIPGFDDILPKFEIESLDMNQVAVKQCTTNILVKFDVKILEKLDKSDVALQDVAADCRCIPLKITESHTRVFKYNATILNAVLPAQLCSLLPRLILNQTTIGESTSFSMFPIKTSSYLSMIEERSRCDTLGTMVQLPLLMFENMSPAKNQLLRGIFPGNKLWRMQRIMEIKPPVVDYRSKFNTPMSVVIPQRVIIIVVDVFYPLALKPEESEEDEEEIEMVSPCTALQKYNSSKSLVLDFSYMSLIRFSLSTFISPIKLSCHNDRITVDLVVKSQGIEEAMSVTVSNVKLDSLFNGFAKRDSLMTQSNKTYDLPLKCIEYICKYRSEKSVKRDVPSIKPKKRPYVKLHKKCKPSSNMVVEKSGWLLSKINTLEEFFECIGPAKSLVSVFDEAATKKILSSITIMKSWITEITARQALLVLLLVNKKDTPNLTRFREILLQGIAVNRITQSSELDMEIEVLENENIKLEPFDETANVRPSDGNDNLLEELLWIAKNTASDHKRPFEESSEKLLKSLLQKRKQLNPSYLRVMARYIGLGLVKSPSKHRF